MTKLEINKLALQTLPGMAPIGGQQPSTPKVVPNVQPKMPNMQPKQMADGQRPTKDEQEQVMRMQQIMAAFGNAIDTDLDAFVSRLSIPKERALQISGAIRNTGKGTGNPFDGEWGQKTITALNVLADLAKNLGTQQIVPSKHYKELNPASVIKASQGNVDAIAALMRAAGFQEAIPESVGVRPDLYDTVPQRLSETNITQTSSDGVPVRPVDLDTIKNFYNFIRSTYFSNMKAFSSTEYDIKKLADKVIDSSVFKLAQDSVNEELILPNIKSSSKMTVDDFDTVIEWFLNRSRLIYQQKEKWNQFKAFRQDDDGKQIPLATEQDVKAAKDYYNAMHVIAKNWYAQREQFLVDDQDPETAIIDPSMLFHYKNVDKLPGSGQLGASRKKNKPVSTKEDQELPQGFELFTKFPQGPIDSTMSLDRLQKFISENAEQNRDWLDQNMSHQQINMHELSRMPPRTLVEMYRRNPSKNSRAFAINMPFNIKHVLNDIFATWRAQAFAAIDSLPDEQGKAALHRNINEQMRILSAWNALLSRMQSTAEAWHQGAATLERNL